MSGDVQNASHCAGEATLSVSKLETLLRSWLLEMCVLVILVRSWVRLLNACACEIGQGDGAECRCRMRLLNVNRRICVVFGDRS